VTGKIVIVLSNLRLLSGLIMEHCCESCPVLGDVGWVIILQFDMYTVYISDITSV
jgi:hypothetical protein